MSQLADDGAGVWVMLFFLFLIVLVGAILSGVVLGAMKARRNEEITPVWRAARDALRDYHRQEKEKG